MTGDQSLSRISRGLAAVRAAEALLRTLGGCTVWVRIPISVALVSDANQLGLAAAGTEDVPLSPVVARHARTGKGIIRKIELLISAASLAETKSINDASGAEEFFESALGIVHTDKLFRIDSILVDEFGGVPYLYRVVVSE